MLPESAQVRVDSSLSETGGRPENSGIPACDYREDGQVQLVHQVVDEQAVPELPAQLDHDGAPTRCCRRGRCVAPGQPHYAPYAGNIAPLTGAAASLTRKAITPAIASGATACAITSAGNMARFLGVSSSCGATAFTRIPCGRSSISRMRAMWTRAALLTL